MGFIDRLQHGWNAFRNRDPTPVSDLGYSYSYRPDRMRFTRGNERTIVTSVYNRIAMDVSGIEIRHCRLDENSRSIEEIKSGLNNCLNLEANLDQTGRAFIQDVVISMFDEKSHLSHLKKFLMIRKHLQSSRADLVKALAELIFNTIRHYLKN